jgi:NitT/TauT family transport system substrate-binding protein
VSRTLLSGLLVLVLAACGSSSGGSSSDESESPGKDGAKKLTSLKIRINWIPGGQHAPLFYGIAKGYYKDEGIDLEVLDGKGSQLAIDDVSAGNADIAMAGTGPAILGMGQGRDIVSVGMPIGAGTYGFFVDEKSDIRTVADLKGKQLLVTPGSPETPLIPPVLKLAGIAEQDVKLVSVEAASKLSAYVGGRGDAMATTIPFYNAHIQPKRPSRSYLFSDFGLVLPDYSYLVTKETLEKSPDAVKGFLRASFKSLDESMRDPEAAVQALKDARSDLVDYNLELQSWKDFLPFICSDAQAGQLLGEHAAADWDKAVSSLVEYSGLDAGTKASDLYTNEFFEGSDPVSTTTCN